MASESESQLFPQLASYLDDRMDELDPIAVERKQQLDKLAKYIKTCSQDSQPCKLVFICTHNSRRSQMGQIWAAAAAVRFGVKGVECYSGGTEVTAFNPRAIAAVERAGVRVTPKGPPGNPRNQIWFGESGFSLICFSKQYQSEPNPSNGYAAIMTCSQADQACPTVVGSSLRLALPYDDPKVSDGQPDQNAVYDERCRQICSEMLYVFSQVAHE